ncbi:hypothetical protein ACW73L_07555 [Methylolobus aquaticus]
MPAERLRLIDIIANKLSEKTILTGGEQWHARDGAVSKKITPLGVLHYVLAQSGLVGRQVLSANNEEEAQQALGLQPGVHVMAHGALLALLSALPLIAEGRLFALRMESGSPAAEPISLGVIAPELLECTDQAAVAALLGLVPGEDVQAHSNALDAIAAMPDTAVALEKPVLVRFGADGAPIADHEEYARLVDLTSKADRSWVLSQIQAILDDDDPFEQYLLVDEADLLYLRLTDAKPAGLAVLTSDTSVPLDNPGTAGANRERIALEWLANLARLVVSKTGTGTQRDLQLVVGDTFWQLKADGGLWCEVAGQTAGNARGAGAVDLQTLRTDATNVASGANAVALGRDCKATAIGAVAIGDTCSATGDGAVALGASSSAASPRAVALGFNAYANRRGCLAYGFGGSGAGANQWQMMGGRASTTNATPTEIFAAGVTNSRFSVPAKGGFFVRGNVVCMRSDYAAAGAWEFTAFIVNNAGTTRIVGSATVTAVAVDAALSACTVAVTADDTNDSLKITVTGLAATNLLWTASGSGSQVIQA